VLGFWRAWVGKGPQGCVQVRQEQAGSRHGKTRLLCMLPGEKVKVIIRALCGMEIAARKSGTGHEKQG
jgi:hypothetical protein